MRLKQMGALLLAGVMITGTVDVMNPTEVKAAGESNTFTLTVPADLTITASGWNSIGNVTVAGNIASDKKVTVEITTENGSKLKSGDNEIVYMIKKAPSDTEATSSIVFAPADVNTDAGASQEIGADVTDFSSKPAGTYEDTINFTASFENVASANIEMTNASGNTLTTANLGNPTEFTVDNTKYVAYNDFINTTSGSNWQDAMDFVAKLNEANYGGHNDWELISSQGMATNWYRKFVSSVSLGSVVLLWSSIEINGDGAYCLDYECNGYLSPFQKTTCDPDFGFVVVRGSVAN